VSEVRSNFGAENVCVREGAGATIKVLGAKMLTSTRAGMSSDRRAGSQFVVMRVAALKGEGRENRLSIEDI
jgi:hypothetical protein